MNKLAHKEYSPVCIVTPHFPGPMHCGGIGTAAYWQALAFAQAGIPVTVLYTGHIYIETPGFWAKKYKKDENITFVGLADWIHHHRIELRARQYQPAFDQLIYSHWVLEYLLQNPFSTVYLQDYQGHGFRALQAKKTGMALQNTQFVLTLHGSTEWGFENLELFTPNAEVLTIEHQEKNSAQLADFIITPSHYMKAWINERWKIDKEKINVIPLCFEDPAPGPQLQKHGPFDHLVFFGRLETRKGLEIFTEAFTGSPLLLSKIKKITFLGQSGCASGMLGKPWIEDVGMKGCKCQFQILDRMNTFEAWAWIHKQKNILLAAPSLADNLPLAVIEPFLRRIPFITTNVGGIPEIVGHNPDVLMPATVTGIRQHLEKIVGQGKMSIRHDTGFQPAKTRAANLRFHQKVAKSQPATAARPARTAAGLQASVIVAHQGTPNDLQRSLAALNIGKTKTRCELIVIDSNQANTDTNKQFSKQLSARYVRMHQDASLAQMYLQGAQQAKGRVMIFTDTHQEALPGLIDTFYQGIVTSGAGALGCLWHNTAPQQAKGRKSSSTITSLSMPVGGALEAGLFWNTFGEGCFALTRQAWQASGGLDGASLLPAWHIMARIGLAGFQVATLPRVLFNSHPPLTPRPAPSRFRLRHEIFTLYANAHTRASLDWRRTLELLEGNGATGNTTPVYQELYHYWASLPDDKLLSAIGQRKGSDNDATISQLRQRLQPLLQQWAHERPRIYVYGAGQHTRVLLGIAPQLANYIKAVIDRNPSGEPFLGWPRITPDKFTPDKCDVILYSSKENELAMHKNLAHHPVSHVLLYQKSLVT